MCGKNSALLGKVADATGSPPRVREELFYEPFCERYYGITPACAGRTHKICKVKFNDRDHPRVCGKNIKGAKQTEIAPGITPACAGRTQKDDTITAIQTDHPRVCGKNSRASSEPETMLGSPPRVREERGAVFSSPFGIGITPACAGRTDAIGRAHSVDGDHPRVCGKNKLQITDAGVRTGSPPRVREELLSLEFLSSFSRITPACAGKTAQQTAFHTVRWDHPRVCGKNTQMMDAAQNVKGSPPRVREKLGGTKQPHNLIGITPACAGKTAASHYGWCRAWDHPRVCGKNQVWDDAHEGQKGSPPRVREKLLLALSLILAVRDHPRVCGKNVTFTDNYKLPLGSPPRVREKLIRSPVQSCVN